MNSPLISIPIMPSYKVESNLLIVRAAGTLGSSTISPSGPTPNVVISKSNDLIQSSQNRLSFLVVSILLLSESALSRLDQYYYMKQ